MKIRPIKAVDVLIEVIGVITPCFFPAYVLNSSMFRIHQTVYQLAMTVGVSVFMFLSLNGLIAWTMEWAPWKCIIGLSMLNLCALIATSHPLFSYYHQQTTGSTNSSFRGLTILSLVLSGSTLLPLIWTTYPNGVDWVGFASLTQTMNMNGTLEFSTLVVGEWTYPPAFPATAAWVMFIGDIDAGRAVFVLGHTCLLAVMLMAMGTLQLREAGPFIIPSMCVGVGLFVKTFDSGYPTVASQLGVVFVLALFFSHSSIPRLVQPIGWLMCWLFTLLIHPTGAIYLTSFWFGINVVDLYERQRETDVAYKAIPMIATLLCIGWMMSRLEGWPTLNNEFAEYGWQGGVPFFLYNALLIIAILIAVRVLEHSRELLVLKTWAVILYCLTFIHLTSLPVQFNSLSILAGTLYSMGMHAFHLVLSIIVAFGLQAFCNALMEIQPTRPTFNHWRVATVSMVFIAAILSASIAHLVVYSLHQHDELKPVSPNDIKLRQALLNLPAGYIYTEQGPWGFQWDLPEGWDSTSRANVGFLELNTDLHHRTTLAIMHDNASYLLEHEITYAISSPLGSMQWALADSNYWQPLLQIERSILWTFVPEGNQSSTTMIPISDLTCEHCTLRLHPWASLQSYDPYDLGHQRVFITEGQPTTIELNLSPYLRDEGSIEGMLCLVFEHQGKIDGLNIALQSTTATQAKTVSERAGFHEACYEATPSNLTQAHIELDWKASSPSLFINPLGISGRSDRLIDSTGTYLHWIEWRT